MKFGLVCTGVLLGRLPVHVGGSSAVDRRSHCRFVVQTRNIPQADGVTGAEFEAEEILKRTGHARAPIGCSDARKRRSVD